MNPYIQAKQYAIKLGLIDLSFKSTIAKELGMVSTDIATVNFKDNKDNIWCFALNANILYMDQLNIRLKNNFKQNIAKNHTEEQLLSAVCSSELFLFFSNKLWELNMGAEDKITKLTEIFIFTMTYLNFGDFLHDQIFRISLGINEPELENELNNLPQEVWKNTVMNKSLYFDLCTKSPEELENLKTSLNLYDYSKEALQYLSIYHNDNCIYREEDGNYEYLNTLSHNKIIQQGELKGSSIINRINTPDFKCLTLKLNQNSKNYYGIIGNENNNAYVVYNTTPVVRIIQILEEAKQLWKEFTKEAIQKTKDRRIFTKLLNFKISGYSSEPAN